MYEIKDNGTTKHKLLTSYKVTTLFTIYLLCDDEWCAEIYFYFC